MRRRRPEERGADEPADQRQEPGRGPGGILALQQSAGNHAVAGMLARRQEPPRSEPPTVDISDLGVVILESWTHQTSPSIAGGGSRQPTQAEDGRVGLEVSARMGSHSPTLQQWMAAGKTIASAAFENKGFKVRLENAHITAFRATEREGEPIEHWSIDGKPA